MHPTITILITANQSYGNVPYLNYSLDPNIVQHFDTINTYTTHGEKYRSYVNQDTTGTFKLGLPNLIINSFRDLPEILKY